MRRRRRSSPSGVPRGRTTPRRGGGAPWLYAVARNAITDGLRRTPEPAAEAQDGPGREPDPAEQRRVGVGRLARPSRARGPSGARAPGDRARVLARALPERDRRVARPSSRHGQDEDAERTRPPRRRARRRARVTPRTPDFDELVGSEVDVSERDRLRRVHDLLLAAGPPPDLAPMSAPATETAPAAPQRREAAARRARSRSRRRSASSPRSRSASPSRRATRRARPRPSS